MADLNPKPKIVYPSSVLAPASPVTLAFARSPRRVPSFVLESIRHDNRASSGVQEVVYERTDKFWEGELEYVASGAEIAAWQAFEESALQGIPFDYYPDATSSAFTTFFLEDQQMSAAYKVPGQYTFKHRFYQYIGW